MNIPEPPTRRPLLSWWVYRDLNGKPKFAVTKHPKPGDRTGKIFSQYHWTGEGWAVGLGGVDNTLIYRRPEIAKAINDKRFIYVVEGEKDADALWESGYAATTNAGGAGKWRKEHAQQLRGAVGVNIVWDVDPAGRMHAWMVRDSLRATGVPFRGFLRPAPGSGHKDVSDVLAEGGGLADLVRLKPRRSVRLAKRDATSEANAAFKLTVDRLIELECSPYESDAKRHQWEAKCPAHDDDSPSLSLAPGKDKPVVIHCHRGCTVRDIAKALGMRSGLFSGISAIDPSGETPEGARAELSDWGNAERFAEDQKGVVVHTPAGWILWDGRYWATEPDERSDAVMGLARQTAHRIRAEAKSVEDVESRRRVAVWADRSASTPRMYHMIKQAAYHPALQVRISQLDSNPALLCTQSGVVDMETGVEKAHVPADMITMMSSVAYNRTAKAPRWDRFLREVFQGDEELIRWVQKAVGYSLTGFTTEQVMFMMYGTGSNGKSTFLDALRPIFGSYIHTAGGMTFLHAGRMGPSSMTFADLAQMRGRRFVDTPEVDVDVKLARAIVKQVTSGEPVRAKLLYGQPFFYRPVFKLWMMINNLPAVHPAEVAVWRRLRVIPFRATFDVDRGNVSRELAAERAGILAWCVRGARRWFREGLGSCGAVDAAVAFYRLEMDTIRQWYVDAIEAGILVENPSGWCSTTVLYSLYERWCMSEGFSPDGIRQFGKWLSSLGLVIERRHDRGWRGVRAVVKEG